MRIMRPSACTLLHISGAVNSAWRSPRALNNAGATSRSQGERERFLLSPLFVLSILASVSHRERRGNVRTRVSRSGPPGRSLHYVNSPPLASSASSRARFVRARAVSPSILRAIPDNDTQRRFRAKYQYDTFFREFAKLVGHPWSEMIMHV